jgi:hypothetical protein
VANPWLKADYGFAQGHARYVELKSRDGAVINRLAQEILLAHRGEKTFLYLHYMDVHNPYTGRSRAPAPFARPPRGNYVYTNGPIPALSPEDLEFTMALYDERIYYMDGHVAELLGFLFEEQLAEDLTVVVTSDHGDEFLEHGGLGHGTTLYEEQIDDFAVLWNPERFEPLRIDRRMPTIDLMPTLLDAYGIPVHEEIRGRRARAPRPIYSELATRKAVMLGPWILHADVRTGEEALYPAGEREGSNAAEREEALATLRPLLRRLFDAPVAKPAEIVPVDEQTRERLRELGYLDGGEAPSP